MDSDKKGCLTRSDFTAVCDGYGVKDEVFKVMKFPIKAIIAKTLTWYLYWFYFIQLIKWSFL